MSSNWLARVTADEARAHGLHAVGGKKKGREPKLSTVLRRQLNSALDADKTSADRVYRFHGALMRVGPVAAGDTAHAVALSEAKTRATWQDVLAASLELEETERQIIHSNSQQPDPKLAPPRSMFLGRAPGWVPYGVVLAEAAATERARKGTKYHISAIYAACDPDGWDAKRAQ